jgi:hypothetical protein
MLQCRKEREGTYRLRGSLTEFHSFQMQPRQPFGAIDKGMLSLSTPILVKAQQLF